MKITKEQITKKLKMVGHSEERINEIHKEANNSSNPEYTYNYWGAK